MNDARFPSPCGRGQGEGEDMSNTLGYLRGELKGGEKKKRVSLGKRVLWLYQEVVAGDL